MEKICKLHFGAYAQVHEDQNVTNTLEERTQGAICIGPTGNLKGACKRILLQSGEKISRGKFTEVPTLMIIMKQVVAMALAKKQNEGLIFENHTGATVNNILLGDEAKVY